MSIKFVPLLQESANFLRNQRAFSLTAFVVLFLIQLAHLFVTPQVEANAEVSAEMAFFNPFTLVFAALNLLMTILLILNILDINQGNYRHFFQNITQSFLRFIPIAMLTLIMVLPLSIGVSTAMVAGKSGDSGLNLILLPAMATGIYIFIKLCLIPYAYLIEKPQMTFLQTLKFTWTLSRGKMLPLLLYVVFIYLFQNMLSAIVMSAFQKIGVFFALPITTLIELFMTIFGFRFYQVYRGINK